MTIMPKRLYTTCCAGVLALAASLFFHGTAHCALTGEAEVLYANYEASNSAGNHLSAHSLAHRYSLLYRDSGSVIDSRFGRYNIAAGYEWATFDATSKSTVGTDKLSASKGHIRYLGEVLIDPKEVPFRLQMYSRDMSRTMFLNDRGLLTKSSVSSFTDNTLSLPTGLLDGIHMESGATLVAGIKNGMSNGYNELLRHFPMLLLDYRDVIDRDLGSVAPVNTRFSRLAFVSLNKKDNWFHYRLLNFNDYLDPKKNYSEYQLQIGTVDQTLQHRWIDFSNWISVSADGQLTRRLNAYSADNYDEFDLNLFAIARRTTWEARSFTNFNRNHEDTGRITYKTLVPVYVNGVLDANTSWSTRFSYNDNQNNRGDSFTDISGGYRIETFRQKKFTLSHSLNVEDATGSTLKTQVITGTLETTSTPLFDRNLTLAASYAVRNFNYDNAFGRSNFLEQTAIGVATYSPNLQTRLALRQAFKLNRGNSQEVSSNINGAGLATAQIINPSNNSASVGNSMQSTTEFSVGWTPRPRLDISLTASEDIFIPEVGQRSARTNVANTITYTSNRLKLASRNVYTYTNDELSNGSSYSYGSDSNATYTFSRSLDSSVGISYTKSVSGNSQTSEVFRLSQSLNYYLYQNTGMSRRVFEVNEAFSTTTENSTNPTTASNTELSLGFRYYPISRLSLSAGGRYQFYSTVSNYNLSYYASAGMNFKLFQASIDYNYGKRKSDGLTEKKLTANVKKSF